MKRKIEDIYVFKNGIEIHSIENTTRNKTISFNEKLTLLDRV